MGRLLFCLWVIFIFPILPGSTKMSFSSETYSFTKTLGYLALKDGTQLAVTYYKPVAKTPNEKFPVLVEMLPYRKDDSFYLRDFPIYSYFARAGFLCAKVDIRGTGSSQGKVPNQEYSEQELRDAEEVIKILSLLPESSGKVGMWGISWGGNNALRVALRNPPALKAILAAHATDDLFHDDVHFIDGVPHVDEYILQMDHENALPAPPDYQLDREFLNQRFNAYPWFLTYLKQPYDNDFWQNGFHKKKLKVPAYLIGGLQDGYRDTLPRLMEKSEAYVKAEMGPWNHHWPDGGVPGPNYEWKSRAVQWWNYWLKDMKEVPLMQEPRFAVYVRTGGITPSKDLVTAPGTWKFENWPIKRTQARWFFPQMSGKLSSSNFENPQLKKAVYYPHAGVPAGLWWGENTGNLAKDDQLNLIFDSEPVKEAIEIIGFPEIQLQARTENSTGFWTARLEDVHPNGEVSLVTGAMLNLLLRNGNTKPLSLSPDEVYTLHWKMHFSTWTFQKGHRIRLSLSQAQFPMAWPSPESMNSKVVLGTSQTFLKLPVILKPTFSLHPQFENPEVKEVPENAAYLPDTTPTHDEIVKDPSTGLTHYLRTIFTHYKIDQRDYQVKEHFDYFVGTSANSKTPSKVEAGFRGTEEHQILLEQGRNLRLLTQFNMKSEDLFYVVKIKRDLYENNFLKATKTWTEKIPILGKTKF